MFRKSDEAIIASIQQGGPARIAALKYLYMRSGIREKGLVIARRQPRRKEIYEAEDFIHEAFILLENHIRQGIFRRDSSIEHYFLGIIRQWSWTALRSENNRLARGLSYLEINQETVEKLTPEVLLEREDAKHIILDLLKKLGVFCERAILLKAELFTDREIAKVLGLKEQNTKNKLVKCRKDFTAKFGDHLAKILDLKK